MSQVAILDPLVAQQVAAGEVVDRPASVYRVRQRLPPQPAGVDAASGVAWIVHGLMVPYVGLFNSIPRLVAIVLMALWAFIMAFLMSRNSSRGDIARPASAPPEPAEPPPSPR